MNISKVDENHISAQENLILNDVLSINLPLLGNSSVVNSNFLSAANGTTINDFSRNFGDEPSAKTTSSANVSNIYSLSPNRHISNNSPSATQFFDEVRLIPVAKDVISTSPIKNLSPKLSYESPRRLTLSPQRPNRFSNNPKVIVHLKNDFDIPFPHLRDNFRLVENLGLDRSPTRSSKTEIELELEKKRRIYPTGSQNEFTAPREAPLGKVVWDILTKMDQNLSEKNKKWEKILKALIFKSLADAHRAQSIRFSSRSRFSTENVPVKLENDSKNFKPSLQSIKLLDQQLKMVGVNLEILPRPLVDLNSDSTGVDAVTFFEKLSETDFLIEVIQAFKTYDKDNADNDIEKRKYGLLSMMANSDANRVIDVCTHYSELTQSVKYVEYINDRVFESVTDIDLSRFYSGKVEVVDGEKNLVDNGINVKSKTTDASVPKTIELMNAIDSALSENGLKNDLRSRRIRRQRALALQRENALNIIENNEISSDLNQQTLTSDINEIEDFLSDEPTKDENNKFIENKEENSNLIDKDIFKLFKSEVQISTDEKDIMALNKFRERNSKNFITPSVLKEPDTNHGQSKIQDDFNPENYISSFSSPSKSIPSKRFSLNKNLLTPSSNASLPSVSQLAVLFGALKKTCEDMIGSLYFNFHRARSNGSVEPIDDYQERLLKKMKIISLNDNVTQRVSLSQFLNSKSDSNNDDDDDADDFYALQKSVETACKETSLTLTLVALDSLCRGALKSDKKLHTQIKDIKFVEPIMEKKIEENEASALNALLDRSAVSDKTVLEMSKRLMQAIRQKQEFDIINSLSSRGLDYDLAVEKARLAVGLVDDDVTLYGNTASAIQLSEPQQARLKKIKAQKYIEHLEQGNSDSVNINRVKPDHQNMTTAKDFDKEISISHIKSNSTLTNSSNDFLIDPSVAFPLYKTLSTQLHPPVLESYELVSEPRVYTNDSPSITCQPKPPKKSQINADGVFKAVVFSETDKDLSSDQIGVTKNQENDMFQKQTDFLLAFSSKMNVFARVSDEVDKSEAPTFPKLSSNAAEDTKSISLSQPVADNQAESTDVNSFNDSPTKQYLSDNPHSNKLNPANNTELLSKFLNSSFPQSYSKPLSDEKNSLMTKGTLGSNDKFLQPLPASSGQADILLATHDNEVQSDFVGLGTLLSERKIESIVHHVSNKTWPEVLQKELGFNLARSRSRLFSPRSSVIGINQRQSLFSFELPEQGQAQKILEASSEVSETKLESDLRSLEQVFRKLYLAQRKLNRKYKVSSEAQTVSNRAVKALSEEVDVQVNLLMKFIGGRKLTAHESVILNNILGDQSDFNQSASTFVENIEDHNEKMNTVEYSGRFSHVLKLLSRKNEIIIKLSSRSNILSRNVLDVSESLHTICERHIDTEEYHISKQTSLIHSFGVFKQKLMNWAMLIRKRRDRAGLEEYWGWLRLKKKKILVNTKLFFLRLFDKYEVDISWCYSDADILQRLSKLHKTVILLENVIKDLKTIGITLDRTRNAVRRGTERLYNTLDDLEKLRHSCSQLFYDTSMSLGAQWSFSPENFSFVSQDLTGEYDLKELKALCSSEVFNKQSSWKGTEGLVSQLKAILRRASDGISDEKNARSKHIVQQKKAFEDYKTKQKFRLLTNGETEQVYDISPPEKNGLIHIAHSPWPVLSLLSESGCEVLNELSILKSSAFNDCNNENDSKTAENKLSKDVNSKKSKSTKRKKQESPKTKKLFSFTNSSLQSTAHPEENSNLHHRHVFQETPFNPEPFLIERRNCIDDAVIILKELKKLKSERIRWLWRIASIIPRFIAKVSILSKKFNHYNILLKNNHKYAASNAFQGEFFSNDSLTNFQTNNADTIDNELNFKSQISINSLPTVNAERASSNSNILDLDPFSYERTLLMSNVLQRYFPEEHNFISFDSRRIQGVAEHAFRISNSLTFQIGCELWNRSLSLEFSNTLLPVRQRISRITNDHSAMLSIEQSVMKSRVESLRIIHRRLKEKNIDRLSAMKNILHHVIPAAKVIPPEIPIPSVHDIETQNKLQLIIDMLKSALNEHPSELSNKRKVNSPKKFDKISRLALLGRIRDSLQDLSVVPEPSNDMPPTAFISSLSRDSMIMALESIQKGITHIRDMKHDENHPPKNTKASEKNISMGLNNKVIASDLAEIPLSTHDDVNGSSNQHSNGDVNTVKGAIHTTVDKRINMKKILNGNDEDKTKLFNEIGQGYALSSILIKLVDQETLKFKKTVKQDNQNSLKKNDKVVYGFPLWLIHADVILIKDVLLIFKKSNPIFNSLRSKKSLNNDLSHLKTDDVPTIDANNIYSDSQSANEEIDPFLNTIESASKTPPTVLSQNLKPPVILNNKTRSLSGLYRVLNSKFSKILTARVEKLRRLSVLISGDRTLGASIKSNFGLNSVRLAPWWIKESRRLVIQSNELSNLIKYWTVKVNQMHLSLAFRKNAYIKFGLLDFSHPYGFKNSILLDSATVHITPELRMTCLGMDCNEVVLNSLNTSNLPSSGNEAHSEIVQCTSLEESTWVTNCLMKCIYPIELQESWNFLSSIVSQKIIKIISESPAIQNSIFKASSSDRNVELNRVLRNDLTVFLNDMQQKLLSGQSSVIPRARSLMTQKSIDFKTAFRVSLEECAVNFSVSIIKGLTNFDKSLDNVWLNFNLDSTSARIEPTNGYSVSSFVLKKSESNNNDEDPQIDLPYFNLSDAALINSLWATLKLKPHNLFEILYYDIDDPELKELLEFKIRIGIQPWQELSLQTMSKYPNFIESNIGVVTTYSQSQRQSMITSNKEKDEFNYTVGFIPTSTAFCSDLRLILSALPNLSSVSALSHSMNSFSNNNTTKTTKSNHSILKNLSLGGVSNFAKNITDLQVLKRRIFRVILRNLKVIPLDNEDCIELNKNRLAKKVKDSTKSSNDFTRQRIFHDEDTPQLENNIVFNHSRLIGTNYRSHWVRALSRASTFHRLPLNDRERIDARQLLPNWCQDNSLPEINNMHLYGDNPAIQPGCPRLLLSWTTERMIDFNQDLVKIKKRMQFDEIVNFNDQLVDIKAFDILKDVNFNPRRSKSIDLGVFGIPSLNDSETIDNDRIETFTASFNEPHSNSKSVKAEDSINMNKSSSKSVKFNNTYNMDLNQNAISNDVSLTPSLHNSLNIEILSNSILNPPRSLTVYSNSNTDFANLTQRNVQSTSIPVRSFSTDEIRHDNKQSVHLRSFSCPSVSCNDLHSSRTDFPTIVPDDGVMVNSSYKTGRELREADMTEFLRASYNIVTFLKDIAKEDQSNRTLGLKRSVKFGQNDDTLVISADGVDDNLNDFKSSNNKTPDVILKPINNEENEFDVASNSLGFTLSSATESHPNNIQIENDTQDDKINMKLLKQDKPNIFKTQNFNLSGKETSKAGKDFEFDPNIDVDLLLNDDSFDHVYHHMSEHERLVADLLFSGISSRRKIQNKQKEISYMPKASTSRYNDANIVNQYISFLVNEMVGNKHHHEAELTQLTSALHNLWFAKEGSAEFKIARSRILTLLSEFDVNEHVQQHPYLRSDFFKAYLGLPELSISNAVKNALLNREVVEKSQIRMRKNHPEVSDAENSFNIKLRVAIRKFTKFQNLLAKENKKLIEENQFFSVKNFQPHNRTRNSFNKENVFVGTEEIANKYATVQRTSNTLTTSGKIRKFSSVPNLNQASIQNDDDYDDRAMHALSSLNSLVDPAHASALTFFERKPTRSKPSSYLSFRRRSNSRFEKLRQFLGLKSRSIKKTQVNFSSPFTEYLSKAQSLLLDGKSLANRNLHLINLYKIEKQAKLDLIQSKMSFLQALNTQETFGICYRSLQSKNLATSASTTKLKTQLINAEPLTTAFSAPSLFQPSNRTIKQKDTGTGIVELGISKELNMTMRTNKKYDRTLDQYFSKKTRKYNVFKRKSIFQMSRSHIDPNNHEWTSLFPVIVKRLLFKPVEESLPPSPFCEGSFFSSMEKLERQSLLAERGTVQSLHQIDGKDFAGVAASSLAATLSSKLTPLFQAILPKTERKKEKFYNIDDKEPINVTKKTFAFNSPQTSPNTKKRRIVETYGSFTPINSNSNPPDNLINLKNSHPVSPVHILSHSSNSFRKIDSNTKIESNLPIHQLLSVSEVQHATNQKETYLNSHEHIYNRNIDDDPLIDYTSKEPTNNIENNFTVCGYPILNARNSQEKTSLPPIIVKTQDLVKSNEKIKYSKQRLRSFHKSSKSIEKAWEEIKKHYNNENKKPVITHGIQKKQPKKKKTLAAILNENMFHNIVNDNMTN